MTAHAVTMPVISVITLILCSAGIINVEASVSEPDSKLQASVEQNRHADPVNRCLTMLQTMRTQEGKAYNFIQMNSERPEASSVTSLMEELQADSEQLVSKETDQKDTIDAQHALQMSDLATKRVAKDILQTAEQRLKQFHQSAKRAKQAYSIIQISAQTPESRDAISMMNVQSQDLDKLTLESKTSEDSAKAAYEELMKDLVKAQAEQDSWVSANDGHDIQMGFDNNDQHLSTFHGKCELILQSYLAREKVRAQELEDLNQAKGVLSGADSTTFVQTGQRQLRGRHVAP